MHVHDKIEGRFVNQHDSKLSLPFLGARRDQNTKNMFWNLLVRLVVELCVLTMDVAPFDLCKWMFIFFFLKKSCLPASTCLGSSAYCRCTTSLRIRQIYYCESWRWLRLSVPVGVHPSIISQYLWKKMLALFFSTGESWTIHSRMKSIKGHLSFLEKRTVRSGRFDHSLRFEI